MVNPIVYSLPKFEFPPKRVVSLVPSITESLFDLGVGHVLVGITDYCIHPEADINNIPRVGGTKNPNISQILTLNPDLVIVNQEENNKKAVQQILAHGVPVWVTFPITVTQTIDLLYKFIGLFQHPVAINRIKSIETTLDWLRIAKGSHPGIKYFCPLWRGIYQRRHIWWMTFNKYTYMHDLLSYFGGINIFEDRQRCYPLPADLGLGASRNKVDGDKRFPRVTSTEISKLNPEIIILPSEPYPFNNESKLEVCEQLSETDAVKNQHIYEIDGSLLTWSGTRIGQAIKQLPKYFQKFP